MAARIPLEQARQLMKTPAAAATTRRYSLSGVSSDWWLNAESKYSTEDVLGQELLQRLKQLELEAAAADCRRAKQKAAVLRAEKALSAKQAVLMDESEAAERQEVERVFNMIDLDGNGTLERDEVGMAAAQLAGRPLIEDELDAAMLAMDADSSGEVDLNEFVEWSKKAKAAGLGLFGGLFQDPRSLSDDYVMLEVALRRERKEAAALAQAAVQVQVQLEAATYEAGLKLRAFAEYERTLNQPVCAAATVAKRNNSNATSAERNERNEQQTGLHESADEAVGMHDGVTSPLSCAPGEASIPLEQASSQHSTACSKTQSLLASRLSAPSRLGEERLAARQRWEDFEFWYAERYCRRAGDDVVSTFFAGGNLHEAENA